MGFLEVAAAMKFLSNADLIWRWGMFTRQAVLAVWIACSAAIVLYLFGTFHFEHDSKLDHVGPVRLTTALAFLAVTVVLVPGLFGRPLGELDSFLPPATTELAGTPDGSTDQLKTCPPFRATYRHSMLSQTIFQYHIVEKLGGEMGLVYEA